MCSAPDRVRQHREAVILRARRVLADLETASVVPVGLGQRLDRGRFVSFEHHRVTSNRISDAGYQGVLPLISVIAVPISAATSVMLPGTIIVLFFCASCAKASTALLGHLELHRLLAARRADRRGDLADRLGGGFGHRDDRRGLALRVVDLGLLLALGARDGGLALAGGDVDLLLACGPRRRRSARASRARR